MITTTTTTAPKSTQMNAKINIKITNVRINIITRMMAVVSNNSTSNSNSRWIMLKRKDLRFFTNRARSFTKPLPSSADFSAKWQTRVGKLMPPATFDPFWLTSMISFTVALNVSRTTLTASLIRTTTSSIRTRMITPTEDLVQVTGRLIMVLLAIS